MIFNLCYSLVPEKLMREWRAQFEAGIPLYDKMEVVEETEPTAQQVLEEERKNLLDEGDFIEYKVHLFYYFCLKIRVGNNGLEEINIHLRLK